MEENSEDMEIAQVREAFQKMCGEKLLDITVTLDEKVFNIRLHLKD